MSHVHEFEVGRSKTVAVCSCGRFRHTDANKNPVIVEQRAPAKTVHRADCSRVFGRYDEGCSRCLELKAGAAPRRGWSDRKREDEARTARAIDEHFKAGGKHDRGECGPVCTAFDY